MTRKRRWTPEEDEIAAKLWAEGLTRVAIARAIGRTPSAVKYRAESNRDMFPARGSNTTKYCDESTGEIVSIGRAVVKNINPHVLSGGCHVCGAKTIGRYCETHAAERYKPDMSVVHKRNSPNQHLEMRRYG